MRRALKFYCFSIMLFTMSSYAHATFVVGLSDTHIQAVLQNYFPISEYAAFAKVSLHEPQVQLVKQNKELVLVIPVDANITGDTLRQGHITVLVGLSYQASNGGLYLGQPKIKQLDLPGVSKKMVDDLRVIINGMCKNSLPLVRIYTVKEHDLNHSLAKSALKLFELDDGSLKLEFGFK